MRNGPKRAHGIGVTLPQLRIRLVVKGKWNRVFTRYEIMGFTVSGQSIVLVPLVRVRWSRYFLTHAQTIFCFVVSSNLLSIVHGIAKIRSHLMTVVNSRRFVFLIFVPKVGCCIVMLQVCGNKVNKDRLPPSKRKKKIQANWSSESMTEMKSCTI